MRILPVLDLQDGQVVRGIAGQRHRYRPIQSRLAGDSRPTTVAAALVAAIGCRDLYVADLDAIQGGRPAWDVYDQLAACGLQLIVDAGVGSSRQLQQLCDFSRSSDYLSGIVVGLESVSEEEFLEEAATMLGTNRAVFSLDLNAGRPKTRLSHWQQASPVRIASQAFSAGFRRLIVLDLAAVGTDCGPPTAGLCQQLRSCWPTLEITSGGGVRNLADVHQLVAAGCNRVLVASALHDGRIPREA